MSKTDQVKTGQKDAKRKKVSKKNKNRDSETDQDSESNSNDNDEEFQHPEMQKLSKLKIQTLKQD